MEPFSQEEYEEYFFFRPALPDQVAGLYVGGKDAAALGRLYETEMDDDHPPGTIDTSLRYEQQPRIIWSFLCTVWLLS